MPHYTARPLPDGRYEVVHRVAIASPEEAADLVEFLNELERNPERRWAEPDVAAGLEALERATTEVEVVCE